MTKRNLFISVLVLILIITAFCTNWQGAGIMFLAWWLDNLKGVSI